LQSSTAKTSRDIVADDVGATQPHNVIKTLQEGLNITVIRVATDSDDFRCAVIAVKIWKKVTDFISSPVATLIVTARRSWTRRARGTTNVARVSVDGVSNDGCESIIV
jgi:hypothetical protein